ncbi:hypothetical protein RND71_024231 [Anisodus tanguticus]|uniref:PPM-type phosphatase domain-containing protein n=1 Tax=Anisodus tanguticus TaxID=243964 RepID=A0AAE1RPC8_9SOLA|nr:hypothetical protein RND71_024231 [Anisodus tanguticus]
MLFLLQRFCRTLLVEGVATSRDTFSIDTQKNMAICGSRTRIGYFVGNITARRLQYSLSVKSYAVSYNKRGFQNVSKANITLGNKGRSNNFMLYQYFTTNVAKRSELNPNKRFGLEGFRNLSQECFSFDTSKGTEQVVDVVDSSEKKIPLKLNSGSFYLPHPAKAKTGGEDAHFICTLTQAIGVADGVGGWADLGIDAGLYARELMSHSLAAIQEEPKGSIDLIRALEKAYVRTKAKCSSTACIVPLTDGGLYAVNLGDSGFMLVRNGSPVFKSPSQQHGFNFPYQLDCNNAGDSPSSAMVFKIVVAPGDVLIAGHGSWLRASDDCSEDSKLAQQRAMDQTKSSPFSDGAREAGFEYHGGKLDDITVVVSYVTSEIMGSEMEVVEQRLNTFVGQLQTEFAILDRLVYKNKNQHRRCSYFHYLLKVRRDLRLLQAANLEEVLSSSFQVLFGKRPKQKVQLLEREISTLLARSFFMGFSLTVLALLARIRVLVQQILLDVICVFNNVSSLSQREQAIKLSQDGFEVFREYFPQKQQVVFLECFWESDKYVLVERQNEKDVGSQEKEAGEDVSVEASKIQYESIEIFLGDDEPGKTASKYLADGKTVMDNDKANSLEGPIQEESNDEFRTQVDSAIAGPSGNNVDALEAGALPNLSPDKNPAKAKRESRNNVAFVSVKRPKVSTNSELGFSIHGTEKGDNPDVDKEDPFFSLLISGNMKSSLF